MLILSNNIFRFGTQIYQQIKGTAMGTPRATNYANLFINKLKNQILLELLEFAQIR